MRVRQKLRRPHRRRRLARCSVSGARAPVVEHAGVKEELMEEEEEQEDMSINRSMEYPDIPRHFLHVLPRAASNISKDEGEDVGERKPNMYAVDKSKRKVVGKEWAPDSFSSRFTCMFCGEHFRKDY